MSKRVRERAAVTDDNQPIYGVTDIAGAGHQMVRKDPTDAGLAGLCVLAVSSTDHHVFVVLLLALPLVS